MKKCKPLKNKWCRDIKDIAHTYDPDVKGLVKTSVLNLHTNKRGHGLLLRQKNKDNGKTGFVWLKFCPFCGADVSERTEKKK